MRQLFLGGTAIAAFISAATAAPLASPADDPPPIFSWTGFYVGGQVGYETGDDELYATGEANRQVTDTVNSTVTTFVTTFPAGGEGGPVTVPVTTPVSTRVPRNITVPVALFGNARPRGVIGGAHAGYNYEWWAFGGGRLLVGIEADINGADYNGVAVVGASRAEISSDIKGSVRGRLGFALGRFLAYGTGGAAIANFDDSYTGPFGGFSASHTRVGYTVGGGLEYALTPRWLLRIEYRYSDYGSFADNGTIFGLRSATIRHRETDNIVQGGFSYRFDPPLLAGVR